MLRFLFFVIAFASFKNSRADSLYVKRITDTLSSKAFFGRGYLNNGMGMAADFIASEMREIGLHVQKQPFSYPVNTFPAKTFFSINKKVLGPGSAFIPAPQSSPCKGSGSLQKIDSTTFINKENKLLVQTVDKLTWSVSPDQSGFANMIMLHPSAIPLEYSCDVDAVIIKKFPAANIIGSITGIVNPDSVIVFTAHYDHLGGLGDEVYFPGANDNAAGVGMLLSLAKWYTANPPPYTIKFIAFAGEEAGLLGSKYFTEHPVFPLKNISFLVNLDLVGNGEEGITVVNASLFPTAFALLNKKNDESHLINNIYSRGKAANSDHYWFAEKGVPSFFIYTMGKRKAYHDVEDISSSMPYSEVNDLQQLLVNFILQVMKGNAKS